MPALIARAGQASCAQPPLQRLTAASHTQEAHLRCRERSRLVAPAARHGGGEQRRARARVRRIQYDRCARRKHRMHVAAAQRIQLRKRKQRPRVAQAQMLQCAAHAERLRVGRVREDGVTGHHCHSPLAGQVADV